MTALGYVGLAYGGGFGLIFVFVWRLTAQAKRLAERLDRLEDRH